jgi:hypothetical protein
LSPLNVTTSAPSASRSPGSARGPARSGSVAGARPTRVVDDDRAVPMAPARRARGPRAPRREAALREVRRMDPEDDARGAVPSGLEVAPRGSGSSSRPRRARARRGGRSRECARRRRSRPAPRARPPLPDRARQPDGEREAGGVVVRDERVLGAGQGDQVLLGEPEPRATPAGRPVDLEEQ